MRQLETTQEHLGAILRQRRAQGGLGQCSPDGFVPLHVFVIFRSVFWDSVLNAFGAFPGEFFGVILGAKQPRKRPR